MEGIIAAVGVVCHCVELAWARAGAEVRARAWARAEARAWARAGAEVRARAWARAPPLASAVNPTPAGEVGLVPWQPSLALHVP